MLSYRFRKCKFHIPQMSDFSKRGIKVQLPQTVWALTFDSLIHTLPDFLDKQNYTFSESSQ